MHLPLLALPGLLLDERLWQAQVAALAARRPVTSFPLSPDTTIAGLAEAALARAPEGRFALAGLSMGGYVALEIVRRAPERVAALALLDTSARPDTAEQTQARRDAIAASASDFDGVVRTLLARLLHPSRVGDPALEALLLAMARRIGRADYVRQQEAIIGRIDSRPSLARIACPTLVLHGEADALVPIACGRDTARRIPGAQFVAVPGMGHDLPPGVVEVLGGHIVPFLRNAEGSPS